MRPVVPLLFALVLPRTAGVVPQESRAVQEQILLAEDARAPGAEAVALLTGALTHPDSSVVRRAIRALGRLERPSLAPHLLPLLNSSEPSLRRAAAEAIAQAAQGFRGDSSSEARRARWPLLLGALRERLVREGDPGVRAMLALSLGRLPYVDPGEISAVGGELLPLCAAGTDHCRGIEMLVRAGWRRAPPGDALLRSLRAVVRASRGDPASRRHALGALSAAQSADDATLAAAFRSADPELRRLALAGIRRAEGRWQSHPVLGPGLVDADPAVRLEAVRALGRVAGASGCARLARAANDPAIRVSLTAIDLLGICRGDSAVGAKLLSLADRRAPRWHQSAHALVALSRASPSLAAPLIPVSAVQATWQIRMYAARAAALTRDSATLELLAGDPVPNVREAALGGLHDVLGHRADPALRDALRARDYQVVLTAAGALAGTPERAAASEALLAALDRLTAQEAETSRDARVAILVRLREVGSAKDAGRLDLHLADFDRAVADSAAAVLTAWTGTAWTARPSPLPPLPVSLAEVDSLRGARLVFTMAGQRQFTVLLLADEAPVTVARIARLVRRHYYDGLTFHRFAPNFVIQGGSPGANEYAGVPRFMRDELGATTHARGTLGVSTRGRDTGDGQLFINLRDNPRLDYEYTVWGRVVSGLEVVDGILEGDEIRKIEIRLR